MKQLILSIVFVTVSILTFSQGSRGCCPIVFRDTLNLSEIQSLHTTPVTLLIPPGNGGVRLVKPAVIYNHCSASGMTFASGEFINIYNQSNVMFMMHQFTDPAVMVQGIYSGYHFQTYEVVRNGQPLFPGSGTILDGRIMINSTFPVTGSTGDYWIIELTYEHLVF